MKIVKCFTWITTTSADTSLFNSLRPICGYIILGIKGTLILYSTPLELRKITYLKMSLIKEVGNNFDEAKNKLKRKKSKKKKCASVAPIQNSEYPTWNNEYLWGLNNGNAPALRYFVRVPANSDSSRLQGLHCILEGGYVFLKDVFSIFIQSWGLGRR